MINEFYGSLNSFEKNCLALEMQLDMAYHKTQSAFQYLENALDYKLKLIDYKILVESGTSEDLVRLCTEAGEENTQEKKGVISNMFSSIARFINGLIEQIKKIFAGKEKEAKDAVINATDSEVITDGDTKGLKEKVKEWAGKLVGFVRDAPFVGNDGKAKDCIGVCKTILAAIGAYTAGKAAMNTIKIVKKGSKPEQSSDSSEEGATNKTSTKEIVSIYDFIMSGINSIKTGIADFGKSVLEDKASKAETETQSQAMKILTETLTKFTSTFGAMATKICSAIIGFGGKVKDTVTNKKKDKNSDSNSNNTSDNNNDSNKESNSNDSEKSSENNKNNNDKVETESFYYKWRF